MPKGDTIGRVQITGLRELQRTLKTAPKKIRTAFNEELQPIAAKLAADVREQMPEKTGNAKRSVKPTTSGGYVAIRAGGAQARYYPWLDFGGVLKKTSRKTFADGSRNRKGKLQKSSRGRTNEIKREYIKGGRWIYPTIARSRVEIYQRAREVVDRWKRVNF